MSELVAHLVGGYFVAIGCLAMLQMLQAYPPMQLICVVLDLGYKGLYIMSQCITPGSRYVHMIYDMVLGKRGLLCFVQAAQSFDEVWHYWRPWPCCQLSCFS